MNYYVHTFTTNRNQQKNHTISHRPSQKNKPRISQQRQQSQLDSVSHIKQMQAQSQRNSFIKNFKNQTGARISNIQKRNIESSSDIDFNNSIYENEAPVQPTTIIIKKRSQSGKLNNRSLKSLHYQQRNSANKYIIGVNEQQKKLQQLEQQRYMQEQNRYCQQQYIKAIQLKKKHDQESKKVALQILQNLFNQKIMNYKTNFQNYMLKESIILNYWKLLQQIKQIKKNKQLVYSKITQTNFNFHQSESNDKISQVLGIAHLFLKQCLNSIFPKPKNNNMHLIILILAKQEFYAGKTKQALSYCDQCLKYLQHKSNINAQMLKIHHLRMKIYQKMNNKEAELIQINRCLFFLKATSMISRQNQNTEAQNGKIGIDLYQYLIARKQQLQLQKQARQIKQRKTFRENHLLKNKQNQQITSFRKRTLSAQKLRKKAYPFQITPQLYNQYKYEEKANEIDKRQSCKEFSKMMQKYHKCRSVSLGKINQGQINSILQKTAHFNQLSSQYKVLNKQKHYTLYDNKANVKHNCFQKSKNNSLVGQSKLTSQKFKQDNAKFVKGNPYKKKLKRKGMAKLGVTTPFHPQINQHNQKYQTINQQIQKQLDNLKPLDKNQLQDQKFSNFIIERPKNNKQNATNLIYKLHNKLSNTLNDSAFDMYGKDPQASTMSNGMTFTNGFDKIEGKCQIIVQKMQNQLIKKYIHLAQKGVQINFGVINNKNFDSDEDSSFFSFQSDTSEQITQKNSSKKRPSGSDDNRSKTSKNKDKKKHIHNNKFKSKVPNNSIMTNQSYLYQQNGDQENLIRKNKQRLLSRTFQLQRILINQEIGQLQKGVISIIPNDDKDNLRIAARKNWFSRQKRPSEDLIQSKLFDIQGMKRQSQKFGFNSSQRQLVTRQNIYDKKDLIDEDQLDPYENKKFRLRIDMKNFKFSNKQIYLNGSKNLKVQIKMSKNINFVGQDRVIDFQQCFTIQQERFFILKLLSTYMKIEKIRQDLLNDLQQKYKTYFRQKFWSDQMSYLQQMSQEVYKQIIIKYLSILIQNKITIQQKLKGSFKPIIISLNQDKNTNQRQEQVLLSQENRIQKMYQKNCLNYEQHKQTISYIQWQKNFQPNYYQNLKKPLTIQNILLNLNSNSNFQLSQYQEDHHKTIINKAFVQSVFTKKPQAILNKRLKNIKTEEKIIYSNNQQKKSQNQLSSANFIDQIIDKCQNKSQNTSEMKFSTIQKSSNSISNFTNKDMSYLSVMDKIFSIVSISTGKTISYQKQYKTLCKRFKDNLINYFMKFKSSEENKSSDQKIKYFFWLIKTALIGYLMMPQSDPYNFALKFFNSKKVTHIHKIKKPQGDKKFNVTMICYTAKVMYSNTGCEDRTKIQCFYKFLLQQSQKRSRFLKFIMTSEDLFEIIKISNKDDGLNLQSIQGKQLSHDQMIKVLMRLSQKLVLKKHLLYFKLGLQNPQNLYYIRVNKFNLFKSDQKRSKKQKDSIKIDQSSDLLQISEIQKKSTSNQNQSQNKLSFTFFDQQEKSIIILCQKTKKIKYGKYQHFGIITISKVANSQIINIRIYIPNKSRNFNFQINQYQIVNYLTQNDKNKIFGSVINSYENLSSQELANIIFVDEQQRKYLRNIHQRLGVSHPIIQQEKFKIPPNTKRIIWNNFINLFCFEQYWTRQGCQLLVKISNFHAFLKDSVVCQYFCMGETGKQDEIFLLQMSLQKNHNIFTSARTIQQKLKQQSHQKRLFLQKKTHELALNQYSINVIDNTNSNQKTQNFVIQEHNTNISPYITCISSNFKQEEDIFQQPINVFQPDSHNYKIYVSVINCLTKQKINACYYLSNIIQHFKELQFYQNIKYKKSQLNQTIYRASQLKALLKNLSQCILQNFRTKYQIRSKQIQQQSKRREQYKIKLQNQVIDLKNKIKSNQFYNFSDENYQQETNLKQRIQKLEIQINQLSQEVLLDFKEFDFLMLNDCTNKNLINRVSLNSTKQPKNNYLSSHIKLVNKQILSLKNSKIQCIFYNNKTKDISLNLISLKTRNSKLQKKIPIQQCSIPFLQVAGQKALKGLNKRISKNYRNLMLFSI